jgi:hypothetical protein
MMEPRDRALSMRISPRARRPEDNEGLRSLLVHRITEGAKLVWRRSLSNESQSSLYCEPCNQWTRVGDNMPIEWQCLTCQREYRIEFAIYEELE